MSFLRQLFFIEGRLIAEGSRSAFDRDRFGSLSTPMSALFFCGHCGEVFAKAPIVRSNGEILPWQSYRLCCKKCTSEYLSLVPGSIWLSWDQNYLNSLPDAVIEREGKLHLDHLERVSNV